MPIDNGSRIVSKWVTPRRSPVCSPNLRQKPIVRQLLLFLDNTNVIRFRKRVHNALVSKSTKFLFLRHQCHASINYMLVRISHWISYVWDIGFLLDANMSRKQHPDPSLLPKKRLTQAEPFTVSDVDFTRALYIREAIAEKRDYICFLTRATTRVVYLVVVTDFSVQAFVLELLPEGLSPNKPHQDQGSGYVHQ